MKNQNTNHIYIRYILLRCKLFEKIARSIFYDLNNHKTKSSNFANANPNDFSICNVCLLAIFFFCFAAVLHSHSNMIGRLFDNSSEMETLGRLQLWDSCVSTCTNHNFSCRRECQSALFSFPFWIYKNIHTTQINVIKTEKMHWYWNLRFLIGSPANVHNQYNT